MPEGKKEDISLREKEMRQLQRELKKQGKKNGKAKKIVDELISKISKNYGLEMAEDVYDIAEYMGEENIGYAIRYLEILASMVHCKASEKYLRKL